MPLKTPVSLMPAQLKVVKSNLTASTVILKLARRLLMLILKKRRKCSLASISFLTKPFLISFPMVTTQSKSMNRLETVSMVSATLSSSARALSLTRLLLVCTQRTVVSMFLSTLLSSALVLSKAISATLRLR